MQSAAEIRQLLCRGGVRLSVWVFRIPSKLSPADSPSQLRVPASERVAAACHAIAFLTRLATSICPLRGDRMEQGPTEPHAGRSTFLLSSGGAGGRVLLSGLW